MSEDAKPLPLDELKKLLEPVINYAACDRTTLTDFQKNRKTIMAKMAKTGSPVVLQVDNQHLLLCDPASFVKMENRRRWVLDGSKKIEEMISIGYVNLPDPRIRDLAYLKEEIASGKKELEDLRENATAKENALTAMQVKADALARDLDSKS